MPTVKEILRQSGLTEEQIDALDAKAMNGFTTVISTAENERKVAQDAATKAEQDRQAAATAATKAEQDRVAAKAAQDAAELAQRSNVEFYETKIVPGLTSWEEEQKRLQNDRVNAEAAAAFYRTQNEAARTAGFIPTEAPKFTPPAADPNQRTYVPNAPGSTPGSPTLVDPTQIASKIGDIAGVISDIQWKHQTLYGRPLPIAPSELIRQADSQRLDPLTFASRQFGFQQREKEIAEATAKEHDAKIAAEATETATKAFAEKEATLRAEFAAKEKLRAEQNGNNPDVRQPAGSAKYAEVRRAVDAGARPDPLKMTDQQRRAATRQVIHEEISQNAEQSAVA